MIHVVFTLLFLSCVLLLSYERNNNVTDRWLKHYAAEMDSCDMVHIASLMKIGADVKIYVQTQNEESNLMSLLVRFK
jgi:hypothetical protein